MTASSTVESMQILEEGQTLSWVVLTVVMAASAGLHINDQLHDEVIRDKLMPAKPALSECCAVFGDAPDENLPKEGSYFCHNSIGCLPTHSYVYSNKIKICTHN